MLGIYKDGVLLDLSPGTALQLERVSPFLNSGSQGGEYTMPLTFPYTPKNATALGLVNHYYTRRKKLRIGGIRIFDNTNFSYTGELVINKVFVHHNDVRRSTITGFFVTGASSFFGLVKDKKLKDLSLGGARTFAWTNNDPASPNRGFWQHVHDTLEGTMEYSFAPIRNEKWAGNSDEGTPDWMNKLNDTGTLDYGANYNTLAPQVSLKYVLQQICEEHGWTFDYSAMSDVQWQTLFMPSFYAVSWQKIIQAAAEPYYEFSPLLNITINLAAHVPPNMTIVQLILALASRYNWGFDWDSGRKVCTLRPVSLLASGVRKDWSRYMSATLDSEFSDDAKVYAFKNEIDAGDGLSGAADMANVTIGAPVYNFAALPAPVEALFNQVVYCWKENQNYQCRYSEESREYGWELHSSAVYNYEPAGANEEITTVASTMPVYNTLYRTNGGNFYGLFPFCEQEGNWEGKQGEFKPWGLRLLFHRGRVWEANSAGYKGQLKYPYLTSICFTPTQEEPDLAWSNVWVHAFEQTDKGIVFFWWRQTLKYLTHPEVVQTVLYLPRPELLAFRWSDVILLRNIPYIVHKFTEVIPYNGAIQTELRRIG